jgi:hypothetical protein
LWDAAKTMFRGLVIAAHAYLGGEKKAQNQGPNFLPKEARKRRAE